MRACLLLVALAAAAPAAQAVQLGKEEAGSALSGAELNVKQSLYYKWNVFLDEDPDDDQPPPFAFQEFINRTVAEFAFKQWAVGAQMDWVAVTPNCSQGAFRARYGERADGECISPNPLLGTGEWGELAHDHFMFQLEKAYLRYNSSNFRFEAGDFYAAFGRGLALSMTRKPEIDIDNSIRGARIDVLTKRFDLTLLGGITNPQQISMELRNLQINKVDWHALVGGQVAFRPVDQLSITGHGVGYDLEAEDKSAVFGGTVAVSGLAQGALDLFVEGNGYVYGDGREGEADAIAATGYSLYGVASIFAGPLTLTVEGKRYKNAFGYQDEDGFAREVLIKPGPVIPIQYNLPPTLEHDLSVTPDINKAIQSLDITGWRATADLWFLMSDTTISASFANSFENVPHPGFSEQREIMIHPMVELRQPIPIGKEGKAELLLTGDVGYRHDFPWRFSDGNVPNRVSQRAGWKDEFLANTGVLHYRLDVGFHVGKHAWELVSTYRRQHWTLPSEVCWSRNDSESCDKDDGWIAWENNLSYTLMGRYTVAVNVDFTDDPRVQSTNSRGARGNLWFDDEFKASAYIGGTVILRPVDNVEINVFGGSQKAGIVCTGGACRTVPAFTGVKARVDLSF